jgi:phage tail-like protein
MTADPARSFHFSTAEQWNACLVVDADGEVLRSGGGIQPFAAYERTASLVTTPGAFAPVVTREGDIIWRDGRRRLHRLAPCDDVPETTPAPSALATAGRMVSTASGLWAVDTSDSLARFDPDTLTRMLTVDLHGTRVVDIADDGRGGVYALAERGGAWTATAVGANGRLNETIALAGLVDPIAFTFLRRSRRFVVLAGDRQDRLYWFAIDKGLPGEGPVAKLLFSRAVAAFHPCFGPVPLPDPCATDDQQAAAVPAAVLASDRRDRIFLAGADGSTQGSRAYVVLVDADGNSIGAVPLDVVDAPPTGVAAGRNELLVTGRRGLLRFASATVVPDGADAMRAVLVTPVLSAPDRDDGRRWLRIDAQASVPEGSTIEIAYASTDDEGERDRLAKIAGDSGVPASQRVAALLSESGIWRTPTTFSGGAGAPHGEPDPFSAKLFDTTDRFVWVRVVLTAAPGAALPRLSALDVRYPGRTLMEQLPAIYQREESQPDSFLRSLVGVLETTTQGLDNRIAQLGSRIDPSSTSPEWLDFLARWLGVPWDDGMTIGQKRRILGRAALMTKTRGTREGLEALLDALVPGTPRRFRVVDTTADFGFARVGGGSCVGSALPAMLGGSTRWNAALGSRSVLGCMRLPCANQPDDGVGRLAGRIRVDLAATAAERKAWEPWIAAVIGEMVPVTARLTLRWVSPHALRSRVRLDSTLTLEGPPAPHLGTDAVTSLARLPQRGHRLTRSGPGISTDLR